MSLVCFFIVDWFIFTEGGLKDAFIEEIQHSIDKTKGDCPDILRNEKCLCLTTSKVNHFISFF